MNIFSNENLKSHLLISNMLGESKYNSEIELKLGNNIIPFNLNNFSQGMYLISIKNENCQLYIKFVKNSD